MRHISYREWLRLSIYDELEGEQKKLLDEHLQSCFACRSEMEKLRKLQESVSRYFAEEASTEQLQQARRNLQSSLAGSGEPRRDFYSVSSRIRRFVYPRHVMAMATAAVLLAGFILGYGVFSIMGSRSDPLAEIKGNDSAPDSGRIENVQFVNQGSADFIHTASSPDQEVEFTFDRVNRDRIKGKLRDPQIRKILALALVNERNPGVRLQSAAAISASGPDFSDSEIREALIDAMVHDENPGVRMQAMETLKTYPYHDSIKKAFLQVLINDKLPGLRIQAINALMGSPTGTHSTDPEIRDTFKQRLINDENSYIRLQAKKFIQENSL